MAELGIAASIIAVIQVSKTVIKETHTYGQTVKNAKKDSKRIRGEVKDIGNILIKLRDLAHRAENSNRSLDYWPTLASIKQKGGPLSECELALNCLLQELAPASGWGIIKGRFLWSLKMKKIENALQAIARQRKFFMEALNVEQACVIFAK
jgi:hypothetical protein